MASFHTIDVTPAYTLYMYVNNENNDLVDYYNRAVEKHNNNIIHNNMADSGFDLIVPKEQELSFENVNKINFQVKCEMKNTKTQLACPFYMYPRSSISKSHFRLANCTGIIDSGYRGDLIGMFDLIYTQENIKCEKFCRLLQICSSTLDPFKVVLVYSDSELSQSERGNGAFGSTGGASLTTIPEQI